MLQKLRKMLGNWLLKNKKVRVGRADAWGWLMYPDPFPDVKEARSQFCSCEPNPVNHGEAIWDEEIKVLRWICKKCGKPSMRRDFDPPR